MAITAETEIISIWPGVAPGSEEWTHQELDTVSPGPDRSAIVRNVVRPSLTPYLPDPSVATGTAVIVCPGGAFHFLAIEHEGTDVARWLAERGIAAFVLRYRLVQTPESVEDYQRHMQETDRERRREATARVQPLAIADGRQALHVVRERAAAWKLVPERVGIMGFSAGGMVTCGVALDADARPAFAAPIYGAPFADYTVPADAPPLFVAVASDDTLMAARSLALYTAWREAGRSAELHAYAQGGHGFGLRRRGLPSDAWIERFYDWMRAQDLVPSA